MARYRYELCDAPPCAAKRSRKKTRNINLETGFWRCHRCGATGREDLGRAPRRHDPRDDSRYITKIFAEAMTVTDQTVAARYLARRGFAGRLGRSKDLLAHPALWHGPSRQEIPALVGVVRDHRDITVGLHRTYLAPDGSKANVEPVRMALGKITGAAVRIDPLLPWDGTVGVVEGIEDALGLRLLRPAWWVWAALNTSGMMALVLPHELRRVVVGPDVDRNGAGQRAAGVLVARLRAEGRAVSTLLPTGHDFGEVGLSSVITHEKK